MPRLYNLDVDDVYKWHCVGIQPLCVVHFDFEQSDSTLLVVPGPLQLGYSLRSHSDDPVPDSFVILLGQTEQQGPPECTALQQHDQQRTEQQIRRTREVLKCFLVLGQLRLLCHLHSLHDRNANHVDVCRIGLSVFRRVTGNALIGNRGKCHDAHKQLF